MKRIYVLSNLETREILAVDVKPINLINLDNDTYFKSEVRIYDLPSLIADGLLALPWKFEKEPEPK